MREQVKSEKRKEVTLRRESCLCVAGWGQRGAKRGASEKQIHNASPTSKSVKISINPSAPITGKTE